MRRIRQTTHPRQPGRENPTAPAPLQPAWPHRSQASATDEHYPSLHPSVTTLLRAASRREVWPCSGFGFSTAGPPNGAPNAILCRRFRFGSDPRHTANTDARHMAMALLNEAGALILPGRPRGPDRRPARGPAANKPRGRSIRATVRGGSGHAGESDRARSALKPRQGHERGRALARAGLETQRSAMELDQRIGDGEAEP